MASLLYIDTKRNNKSVIFVIYLAIARERERESFQEIF